MGGDLERARQLFADALARHVAQDFAQAEPLYREALSLAPQRPSIVFNLARLLLDRQQYAEAETLFRESVALAPDRENRYNLAVCLARQARHADALAGYDEAIALDAKFIQAHGGRAAALEQLGRHAEALEGYARSVELAPEVPAYQQGFARCARLVERDGQLATPALIETATLICLMAAKVDGEDLKNVVLILLERRFGAFQRSLAESNFDWQKIAASHGQELQAFCNDWLLMAALEKILLDDAPSEDFFTRLRAALLKFTVIGPKHEQLAVLLEPLALFLALQAAFDHHAWPVADAETALRAKLRARIDAGLESGAVGAIDIGVLGCYMPLADVPGLAAWGAANLAKGAPALQRLIRTQLAPG